MLKSEQIRRKESIHDIVRDYRYNRNIPQRGLLIDNRPAMTQIDPQKVGEYVLVTVRDPLCSYECDPAKLIAEKLEKSELIGLSGMFTSYSGTYKGARITVVSGGSGASEAELLLYDYMEYSTATTYIRVGGSGGMGDDVNPGDIVISSGVVREDGMTSSYIPQSFPAVCNYEVILAMVRAAEELKCSYHVGITLSVSSDFVGCGRPGVGGYLQPWNVQMPGIYNRAGVLNGDRESAAIVTLANLFGFRGGSVCSVADNIITGKKFEAGCGHLNAIDLVLEGCAVLHQMDYEKASKRYWYPELTKERGNLI